MSLSLDVGAPNVFISCSGSLLTHDNDEYIELGWPEFTATRQSAQTSKTGKKPSDKRNPFQQDNQRDTAQTFNFYPLL